MERPSLPCERVLTVPELLDMIFSFLDNKSNINNACVSKQWSSIALDKLWRSVKDISRLFSLLAPLEPMTPGIYQSHQTRFHFTKLPTAIDWEVFMRYSRRVRNVVVDQFLRDGAHSVLDTTVFDTLARTRITLDILPNNKSLSWKSETKYLKYCVLFLHLNLTELTLSLQPPNFGDLEDDLYRPIFGDVLARSPNITLLDLRASVPATTLQFILADYLPKLTRLQKIVFPQFFVTSRIAQAVSMLDDLECLEFQYPPTQGYGNSADVRTFEPILELGAFPSLLDMSLTASFNDMARLLENPFAPQHLTMIFVESFQVEQPVDFEYIISVMVEHAPLLEQLCVLSEVDASGEMTTPKEDETITLSHIRGILALPHLRHFEMHHQYALDVTQDDIEELALNLPNIEVLILNCEPASIRSSTLTLEATLPFAKHCKKLYHLALFLDASDASIPPVPENELAFPRFQSLQRFWAGTSLIAHNSEGPISLFLSQIFPMGCIIDSGITWSTTLDDSSTQGRILSPQTWGMIQERCTRWMKVREMLPLLTQLRGEERDKSKALRVEVEDLRMRTDVLMADKRFRKLKGDGCVLF